MQAHVDAGGNAGRGDHAAGIDKGRFFLDVELREFRAQVGDVFPVGGDGTAFEHAKFTQQESAGANRCGQRRVVADALDPGLRHFAGQRLSASTTRTKACIAENLSMKK